MRPSSATGGTPTNPLRGETVNPWSSARTPGGSSGGASASLATGIGAIAHGNDLGGSLRQPANCCGLVTVRPSLGRVPAHSASAPTDRSMALQLMSVQGPIGRSVADVRLGLDVMAQPSPRDPWYRHVPLDGPREHGPLKVAVSYGTGEVVTDPEVTAAVDEAARLLAAAGYEVSFVDPPDLDAIRHGWLTLLATETAVTAGDTLAAITSDDFQALMKWMLDGAVLDLAGYIAAYTERAGHVRRWLQFLDDHPLVVMPVSQHVPFAPGADTAGHDSYHAILRGHTPLVAVNYLGLPSAAVPVSLTGDGPLGVQIVGRPFREDQCLDAAQAIENHTGVVARHLWERTGS